MSAENWQIYECRWCGREYVPADPGELDACEYCKTHCEICECKLTEEEIKEHLKYTDFSKNLAMCTSCNCLAAGRPDPY